MTIARRLARLKNVMEEWDSGSRVWHRADGRRGIVVEHSVDAQGCCMILVSFCATGPWEKCLPEMLSGTPVGDGSDGDEWKDGKEPA